MPQRAFWTERHACSLTFELTLDPQRPDTDPLAVVKVYDQAREVMAFGGTHLPQGFATYALNDAVKAATEAFEMAEPADVIRAFQRTAAAWRSDVKQLGLDRI